MLLQHFLEKNAQRLPDKVSLVCGNGRWTYSQIETMANRLANAMLAYGLRRGDRVVLYLPNTLELVAGIFATLKAGGVFVPVNPTTKRDKLTYILNNCRATGILFSSRQVNMLGSIANEAPSLAFGIYCGSYSPEIGTEGRTLLLPFEKTQREYSGKRPLCKNIDLDLAGLIYTSGTTGVPKGVMCDHSNMVFAAKSIIQYLENVDEDIVINVLPLSFDYGLYQLLMVFCFGGTLVLERGFAFPAHILGRVEKERVTGFPGVPMIYNMLVRMDLSTYDLSSLRYMTNTAAALSAAQIDKIREKFAGVTMFSMYGLTETKRTLYLPPEQLDQRAGSVGIAIPGTEVWLEDETGRRLGPREVGELVVRGRHVMRGYWEDPLATSERYRPGPIPGERLCYTGDLFQMDEEGYLYFLGRKDDIIKSRGEKVAPKEVESVLNSLAGVAEAAVIGVTDNLLGEAIKAIIVRDDRELTESQVLAYCREHLEDFMIPKFVEFRDTLPRTASGKVKKTALF